MEAIRKKQEQQNLDKLMACEIEKPATAKEPAAGAKTIRRGNQE